MKQSCLSFMPVSNPGTRQDSLTMRQILFFNMSLEFRMYLIFSILCLGVSLRSSLWREEGHHVCNSFNTNSFILWQWNVLVYLLVLGGSLS